MEIQKKERDLVLRFCDGVPSTLDIAYELSKFKKKIEIYKFFIDANITGNEAFSFYKHCNYSILTMAKVALSKIEDKKKETIYYNKDYFPIQS